MLARVSHISRCYNFTASLKLFAPPPEFSEFCLLSCTVAAASVLDLPLPSPSPGILLCLQGKATVTIVSSSSSSNSSSSSSSITALHCLLIAPTASCILRVHADDDVTLYVRACVRVRVRVCVCVRACVRACMCVRDERPPSASSVLM